jgi:hypothetical protein
MKESNRNKSRIKAVYRRGKKRCLAAILMLAASRFLMAEVAPACEDKWFGCHGGSPEFVP